MRIALVVIDSGGIGAAPDAARFGDAGASTIHHALEAHPVPLPHLAAMGLGALTALPGTRRAPLHGSARRLHPRAAGKDTLAGHWEMMTEVVAEPFPTYPHGFPGEVRAELEKAFGRPLLGNRPASGTAIIQDLGAEHIKTGRPIVYTSADSVLQIAAHEEVVALNQLYAWCRAARAIMTGRHRVGRIIARPFVGRPGAFVRTPHRHDYAVAPGPGIFTAVLEAAGVETVAIGKIWDIFSGIGFGSPHPTASNADGLQATLTALRGVGDRALVFTNLVDFDSHFGHRRDPRGYAEALSELDAWVPEALAALGPDDQLWITADHGCDPTWRGSDHTREDSPLIIAGPEVAANVLHPGDTLADIAATLADAFQVAPPGVGRSVWREVTTTDE